MPQIVMYRSNYCPYCNYAKRLLDSKGLSFKEINVETDPALLEEMLTRSNGRRTVPQIFVGDVHVGGYDDLAALDQSGKLDELLATA